MNLYFFLLQIIDLPSDGLRCLLTPIERGVECTNLQFHSLGHVPPPGVPLADVKLSAYVAKYPELHTKLTAFNLTVKDATIHRKQRRILICLNKLINLVIDCMNCRINNEISRCRSRTF